MCIHLQVFCILSSPCRSAHGICLASRNPYWGSISWCHDECMLIISTSMRDRFKECVSMYRCTVSCDLWLFLICVCSTAECDLIYYGATFIIPSAAFWSVWLTDGCDMRPTCTFLSGLSRKGRADSTRTCGGTAVNLLVLCWVEVGGFCWNPGKFTMLSPIKINLTTIVIVLNACSLAFIS